MTLEPMRVCLAAAARGHAPSGAADRRLSAARARRPAVAGRPAGHRAAALQGRGLAALRLGTPRRVRRAAESLELPAGFNPRTLAWARALRAEPARPRRRRDRLRRAVLQHIRDAGFSYTLAPGDYGRDAIDEFWLDRKDGFCEHFAAAFVVVMRAAGVPARVVTGYQGADPTPVDGYYIVRQSYAHAWAEYWQPGRGWVRVDPTAAVAPDRDRAQHAGSRRSRASWPARSQR